jgi:hypothetical protein
VRGKWAKGIVPRSFIWIIKDRIAVSERPGGCGEVHRRVRRQEEIIWIRENGFDTVLSLLASDHNLHNYDELDMAWSHISFGGAGDGVQRLEEVLRRIDELTADGLGHVCDGRERDHRVWPPRCLSPLGVLGGVMRQWLGQPVQVPEER